MDFIASRPDLVTQPEGGRRPRALVPVCRHVPSSLYFWTAALITDNLHVQGCGRGYDVVMLALHGFDAIGLEVSQKAVDAATAYAEVELSRPSAYNFPDEEEPKLTSCGGMGTVKFVCGDFFQSDWEASCFAPGDDQGFDLIYDYTVGDPPRPLVEPVLMFGRRDSSYAPSCPKRARIGLNGCESYFGRRGFSFVWSSPCTRI